MENIKRLKKELAIVLGHSYKRGKMLKPQGCWGCFNGHSPNVHFPWGKYSSYNEYIRNSGEDTEKFEKEEDKKEEEFYNEISLESLLDEARRKVEFGFFCVNKDAKEEIKKLREEVKIAEKTIKNLEGILTTLQGKINDSKILFVILLKRIFARRAK